MDKRKAKCGGYGMFTGFLWMVALGIVCGVLLGIPFKPQAGWTQSELAALLATGFALAYAVLAAIDWLAQRLSLSKNPLPGDLELSDRGVARERLASLAGGGLLHRHLRRLLAAWSAGASGPQVAAMAGTQMLRNMLVLAIEAAAVIVLLVASADFGPPQQLLTLGTGLMALVAVIALARFQLASQIAGYIESHLLAKIGNDTPAAAGVEFAKNAAKSVADSTSALAAAQAKFTDQLAQSQTRAADLLARAQEEAAAQLAKTQAAAAAQIAQAQQEASARVAKAQDDMSARLTSALDQSSAKIGAAQTEVATQLGRVTALATTIDNVLRLQQTVEGTLKGVAVTDEFKSTLVELKRHLAESDQLLKNAAKPRSIRLVEKDGD